MNPGSSTRLSLGVLLFCTATLLASCGPMPELEERMDYWTMESSMFLRGLVTLEDIHPWLRERGVVYTFEDDDIVDGTWAITLEKVYPSTIRCKWVDIKLVINFDDARRVQSSYVDLDGACWW